MYPVNGYTISNHFGVKNDRYKAGYHTGVDIKAPAGTPVVSVRPCKVIEVSNYPSWGESYGTAVIVEFRNGLRAIYAHLSKTTVIKGQDLAEGAMLGKVGTTGNSTGNHLHFELRESPFRYDDHLDPTDLILLTNEDKQVAKKATVKKVANAKSPGKPKPANTKATRTDSSPSV
jgi:murein DD-endopeptidase MepM/ murein hydrolase activator NlpD